MTLHKQIQAHRESIKAVLGAPPDHAPLVPETIGIDDMGGYRREKIKYQIAPREWGAAYLLIPNDVERPAPAVFCHHRHNRDWRIGKSEVVGMAGDTSHAIGLELVQRGYIVFAPDAVSFEDRAALGINHDDPLDAFLQNYAELSVRLLRGETLLKKVIWDANRGVDYMLTRPEIDPDRLAVMGFGYGAKMAIWLMAFDERVFAGVGHGSLGSMHAALRNRLPIQVEFSVPRLLQIADYDRILSLISPRPFLMSAATNDPESSDAETVYQKAKRTYLRMGAGNRFSLYTYDDDTAPGQFAGQARQRAYTWLDNWLLSF
jgi:dienelactone hydrolase